MSEGGKNKGSNKSDTLNKPERTDEKLGEIAGVSKKTIRNTETILTKGTPEDIKQVREGEVSISGKAKENMSDGGKGLDKLPKDKKIDTREELGKIAGVSGKTIDRAEIILTKGTKEDIQDVREISFSSYLRNSV